MHPAYKSWSCEAASLKISLFKNKHADLATNILYLFISMFMKYKPRNICEITSEVEECAYNSNTRQKMMN